MLDKIIYTNHMNEKVVFGQFPFFANYSQLRDFEWDVTETNSKILSFEKGIRDYRLPVTIMCSTEEEGIQKKNELYELLEKDVLSLNYGTLQIGDYKMQCYVKGSTKSEFLISKKYLRTELSIVTDRPYWTKEKTFIFMASGLKEEDPSALEFLDFDYEFAYDYTNSVQTLKFFNPNFVASDFRLTIYGAALNPQITINGHTYKVNCTVEEGQILIVDSIEKTVNLITKLGAVVNKFNSRDKGSYIFEKVPTGNCNLTRSDNFRFDLTLIEERGEPKWT